MAEYGYQVTGPDDMRGVHETEGGTTSMSDEPDTFQSAYLSSASDSCVGFEPSHVKEINTLKSCGTRKDNICVIYPQHSYIMPQP